MPIISTSLIPNETPQSGATNPWEEHNYEYQTQFEDPSDFCEHVSWVLSGDVPAGIEIDSDSGLISGQIKHFGNQPSCQDNKPKEQLEFDGSNCLQNGRFKEQTYDFHFTITRNIMVWTVGALMCAGPQAPFAETSDVYIKEVKDHNIDNLIFMEQYIDEGKSSEDPDTGAEIPTTININGKEYTDSASAVKNHVGPFHKV